MWQERFHGDPAVIGKTQGLAEMPHTIVGVAPKGFYGTFVGYAFQFWVPASMQTQFDGGVYKLEDRGARWIEGFVRLKPGVTIDQEQAELSAIASRLESASPAGARRHRIGGLLAKDAVQLQHLLVGADCRRWLRCAAQSATNRRVQRNRSGLFVNDRHPDRRRPRVHAGRR